MRSLCYTASLEIARKRVFALRVSREDMIMPYTIDRVDVWAGTIKDQPGGVATVLDALAEVGTNLEFVIARRDAPGTGVVFVAPLKGAALLRAAKKLGLRKAETLQSLRVEGPDIRNPEIRKNIRFRLGRSRDDHEPLAASQRRYRVSD
jgi:hypothetical protein